MTPRYVQRLIRCRVCRATVGWIGWGVRILAIGEAYCPKHGNAFTGTQMAFRTRFKPARFGGAAMVIGGDPAQYVDHWDVPVRTLMDALRAAHQPSNGASGAKESE